MRVRIEEFTRTFAALDTSLYTLDEDVDFLGRVLLTNNVLAALDEQRRIVAFIAYGDGKHTIPFRWNFRGPQPGCEKMRTRRLAS